MHGKSPTPPQEKIKQLKNLFPEVFTEDKVDWEKLQATLGEAINFSHERYILNWAGKSEAFRELRTPSTQTLIPEQKESVHFNTTQNVFIEGENLEVLKVLRKSYFGKVKMIYIHPPYNTGNDSFVYNDQFAETKESYQKRIGDKDENGYMTTAGSFLKNSKENGQYHSNWLNMIYPRLFLAKNLLQEDGVIFVSIDDHEVHNLRLVMNEIFGEENFVGVFLWQRKKGGGNDSMHIATEHEYIYVYAKSKMHLEQWFVKHDENYLKRYSLKDEKGAFFWDTLQRMGLNNPIQYAVEAPDGTKIEGQWTRSEKRFYEDLKKGEIRFLKLSSGTWSVQFKQYLNGGKKPRSMLEYSLVGVNADGRKDIERLGLNPKVFSNPKPQKLLNWLLKLCTDSNDLILDFFAGSATTAHAVMDLNQEDGGNRRYICVQMPETCDEKSEAYQAGFRTIADIAKERIRRAAQKIQEKENKKAPLDLGFKVFKLAHSNFKQWQQFTSQNPDELTRQMQLHINPITPEATAENMIYELLLKSGKPLNSTIVDKHDYYIVNDNELILILHKINQEIVHTVIKENPAKVITLDNLFQKNDQLKTNTALQMKDANIEFKTI